MTDFKFEIGSQQIRYNHFDYVVGISERHYVMWEVLEPGGGSRRNSLMSGGLTVREVARNPSAAVKTAHGQARTWIDNYVKTHLALQETMEEAQSTYGGVVE